MLQVVNFGILCSEIRVILTAIFSIIWSNYTMWVRTMQVVRSENVSQDSRWFPPNCDCLATLRYEVRITMSDGRKGLIRSHE